VAGRVVILRNGLQQVSFAKIDRGKQLSWGNQNKLIVTCLVVRELLIIAKEKNLNKVVILH
jgi:hypothetical protein